MSLKKLSRFFFFPKRRRAGLCGALAPGSRMRQCGQWSGPDSKLFRQSVQVRIAMTFLVPWKRDELHKSRSAAPGSQGATTAHSGPMQGRSNAASRDAPPANYATHHVSRGL